jgi:hypothetical protein
MPTKRKARATTAMEGTAWAAPVIESSTCPTFSRPSEVMKMLMPIPIEVARIMETRKRRKWIRKAVAITSP